MPINSRLGTSQTVDGPLAAHKVITAIRTEIAAFRDFDPIMVHLAQEEIQHQRAAKGGEQQDITVWPYRSCDWGHPVRRAQFTLGLAPLWPPAPGVESLTGCLRRSLLVDLLESPHESFP